MRVVVLGSGGLLGRHMLRAFPGSAGFPHAECDVTNYAHVKAAIQGADIVVNCAAMTDVDGCESEQSRAWLVNAMAPETVARACKMVRAALVHISTELVFDGQKGAPYVEKDEPRPRSVYGRTKLEGEQRALAAHSLTWVFRVQSLYGRGGKNFPSKLVEAIRVGAASTLKLDNQRVTQPTWAGAVARQVARAVRNAPSGVYHTSCRGQTTWAEFARAAAAMCGTAVDWEEVPTSRLSLVADRPKACVFAHEALAATGIFEMPDWREALATYFAEEG